MAVLNVSQDYIAIGVVALLTLALYAFSRPRSAAKATLPPGPKGLPLLGNLLDMPSRTPWIKFAEWSKVYGIPCQLDSLLLRLTEP